MIHRGKTQQGSEEEPAGKNGRKAARGKAGKAAGEQSRVTEGLALLVLSIRL